MALFANRCMPVKCTQRKQESIDKARDCIHVLSQILGALDSLEALQESECPVKRLLEDDVVAERIRLRLVRPNSGNADDEICQWLYETYQTQDGGDLQTVVLRFMPILCGVYLLRIANNVTESLAGFEAVLLALYMQETIARGGRPLEISIPDLSQTSLYHIPRVGSNVSSSQGTVGRLAAPLEPQIAMKATNRACIVSVALDLFYRRIAFMPAKAKIEACFYAYSWAGQFFLKAASIQENGESYVPLVSTVSSPQSEVVQDGNSFCGSCPTKAQEIEVVDSGHSFSSPPDWLDENHNTPNCITSSTIFSSKDNNVDRCSSCTLENGNAQIHASQAGKRTRIPLPWELLQPIIKVLGHCLLGPLNSQEVRNAASSAVHALYLRASHDLVPQAILATGSLMRLDSAARASAKDASSVTSTLSKSRKPDILLVSK